MSWSLLLFSGLGVLGLAAVVLGLAEALIAWWDGGRPK